MIIKNKTILITLFSVALFLIMVGAASAQSCPPGFNYCSPPGACLPPQGENPDCTAANRNTDNCGNCTSCLPGYITCSGNCVEPYEGENPVCQAQGKGTDQCGECTGCAPGKILCGSNCVDPQIDTNVPSCDARRRGFNQCTGACTACWSGWYDCDGDADNICEQNPSLEGTVCGGGFGVCQDACCINCYIDQPYVPMAGDFGTPAPDDRSVIDSVSYTNPIIFVDHLDGALNKDYMNFATNGNTEFIVNNKGHLMIGLNAAGTVLSPTDNAIYTLVEGTAQGNFLLFQKNEGVPTDIFSISHQGEICWNGDCRSSWGEVGGGGTGSWNLIENRPADKDHIYPGVVGDYGDLTAGLEGGLRITDTGDIYMDGTLNGGNDSNFYFNSDQDVQIRLDSDNTFGVNNLFKINNDQNDTIFTVDEFGNANSSSCWGAVYVGFTANTNGGVGGYAGANARCNVVIEGSHVCTTKEILNSINCGSGLDPVPAIGYAWISNGPPGYLAPANDCQGWNSSNPTNLGDLWRFDQNKGVAATCNVLRPFACCK